MSSAQSCSEMGKEVPDLVGFSDPTAGFSEPTAEQLQALMGYHNIFPYESLTSMPTGCPRNLKLPSTVSHLGIRPSGGNLDPERPVKHFKEDSSFQCQQRFSNKISMPPSIYVPNSQQKLQHSLLENYFSNFFKPKVHQTCAENMGPATLCKVCKKAEILATLGGHDHSCISDISHSHIDGSSASSTQFFQRNDGLSDMRISSVPAGNRHSNQVPNRASGNSHDHIMAERNRREKLNQRFISLAAIVPGLKKMDKISVLGDTIKYVKQLQDRIKTLEEQTSKQTVQSVVYVKKLLCTDDQYSDKVSSSSINSSPDKDGTVVLTPEIEIRVINGNVLIHAHCERRKGLLIKFIEELDKLQLTVVNASILSFSEATFDFTFNAQMEEGCNLTVTDMVNALQAVFRFHGND